MAFRRAGKTKRRVGFRPQLFENILIVTDGEQTETNYFEGLKNSFPEELRRKIRIKVINQIDTEDLISVAMKEAREDATFREIWIVFDRDDRPNDFDTIIAKAEKTESKQDGQIPASRSSSMPITDSCQTTMLLSNASRNSARLSKTTRARSIKRMILKSMRFF